MINDNKNRAENEKSHRYDITRPRPRHGHKYIIYKICLNLMMAIYIKQHLGNTEAELKNSVAYKKACSLNTGIVGFYQR